jgi:hypothetical protein
VVSVLWSESYTFAAGPVVGGTTARILTADVPPVLGDAGTALVVFVVQAYGGCQQYGFGYPLSVKLIRPDNVAIPITRQLASLGLPGLTLQGGPITGSMIAYAVTDSTLQDGGTLTIDETIYGQPFSPTVGDSGVVIAMIYTLGDNFVPSYGYNGQYGPRGGVGPVGAPLYDTLSSAHDNGGWACGGNGGPPAMKDPGNSPVFTFKARAAESSSMVVNAPGWTTVSQVSMPDPFPNDFTGGPVSGAIAIFDPALAPFDPTAFWICGDSASTWDSAENFTVNGKAQHAYVVPITAQLGKLSLSSWGRVIGPV